MQLTTKKLKSLISEVLDEAARGVTDLHEEVFVTIEKYKDEIRIYYSDSKGNFKRLGVVKVEKISEYAWSRDLPCDNGMMISYSHVASGWGPMLYDVAMEVATILAGGLTSDRTIVSDDAYGVWDYYLNKRPNVSRDQLDNEDGDLTPDIQSDDCLQNSAHDHRKKSRTWQASPLSKIYSKDPSTLQTLQSAGKLINKMNLSF